MDRDEMLAAVMQASKAHELSELVASYRGYRTHPNGATREITIEVWDSLDPADPYRVVVEARDDEGRQTRCNGDRELKGALAITHWHELDRETPH